MPDDAPQDDPRGGEHREGSVEGIMRVDAFRRFHEAFPHGQGINLDAPITLPTGEVVDGTFFVCARRRNDAPGRKRMWAGTFNFFQTSPEFATNEYEIALSMDEDGKLLRLAKGTSEPIHGGGIRVQYDHFIPGDKDTWEIEKLMGEVDALLEHVTSEGVSTFELPDKHYLTQLVRFGGVRRLPSDFGGPEPWRGR